jgi:hypothetical protein
VVQYHQTKPYFWADVLAQINRDLDRWLLEAA